MKHIRLGLVLALLGVIATISTLTLLYVRGTLWRSVPPFWGSVPANVVYDGKPATAEVYRGTASSASALLLVDLSETEGAIYVVNLDTHKIGAIWPYDYGKAVSPPLPSMLESQASANLRVEPYSVEFTSARNVRVLVRWTANL
jgi:hypothetical protein